MNEKWTRMPVREDVYSRRILRDSTCNRAKWGGELLHLRWIFPLVLESTYEGAVGSAIRVDSGPCDLVLVYRFLWKIFGSFLADVLAILHRIPVWYHGASAICLDLPSVRIFEKIREILVVPVCHRSYTSDNRFNESGHLVIFWLPWPMTLAPTNEAIRHETSGKKRPYPSRQQNDQLDEMSCKRCKDRFLSKKHKVVESRRLIG